MDKLNGMLSEENNFRGVKSLYICLYLIISGILIQQLYGSIINRFFEMDLWWMIPSVFSYTEGESCAKIFKFIIGTEPYMLGAPIMKSFLFFVSSFLGPQPKNFIFALLIIHFLNSILLFSLSKRLGLSSRVSFFSALTYLALYAHFESYTWAGNVQHISVTFFILLVLNLYLKTNELIDNGESYRKYLILTLVVNLAATFSRISIFILPATILAHILLCSRNDTERVEKYNLWIPLFISYLIYPLICLASVGDDQIEIFLILKSIPPILTWLIFFFLGILSLFLFRFCLQLYPRYKDHRFKKGLLLSTCGAIYLLAVVKDVRNLLLPYNIMVPFAGTLLSFFRPFYSVFLIDPAQWDYRIHSQMNPFGFLLGLVFLTVFLREFALKKRQLLILLVWYIIPFFYLNLYSNILSRYIVYISPVFSLIVSSVIICLYDFILERLNLKRIWKEIVLALIFTALLIPNIMAIKLEMLRNKMATSFYLYDYIRIADMIKHDLMEDKIELNNKTGPIYITGVKLMPFKELWDFSPVDADRYYNFRFVLSQVLDGVPKDNFRINEDSTGVKDAIVYAVSKDKVINAITRENIDTFTEFFHNGLEEYQNGNYNTALSWFEKAVEIRPFLLNYILSNYSLEDSRWITDGKDLSSWTNRIIGHVSLSGNTEKSGYIKSIIHRELSSYIQSLFYCSYLSYKLDDLEASKYWFSKIQYLEADPEKVYSLLSRIPGIDTDTEMLSFLKMFTNPVSFTPSLWYLPNRDRTPTDFQLFFVKFIFDGRINNIIDTTISKYKKKLHKEREKAYSMPQTL
jgi:tetratricopeptide (TPR) repeat protein